MLEIRKAPHWHLSESQPFSLGAAERRTRTTRTSCAFQRPLHMFLLLKKGLLGSCAKHWSNYFNRCWFLLKILLQGSQGRGCFTVFNVYTYLKVWQNREVMAICLSLQLKVEMRKRKRSRTTAVLENQLVPPLCCLINFKNAAFDKPFQTQETRLPAPAAIDHYRGA